MATLADSYSESNLSTASAIYAGDTTAIAQSFTAIEGVLDSAKFYLRRFGSPTGTAYAKLYVSSGTFGAVGNKPTTELATSDGIDVSTFTSGSSVLETFNFMGVNRVSLTNGENYCIAIYWDGGNSSNYFNVGIDTSSPSHSGRAAYLMSGTWYDDAIDMCFYVYEGDPASTGYSSPFPSFRRI